MRAILVDWLVQVNDKFRLLQETLFLTVSLLDRYLAVSVNVINILSANLIQNLSFILLNVDKQDFKRFLFNYCLLFIVYYYYKRS